MCDAPSEDTHSPIPPFRGISCRARLRVFLCMSSSVMPWYTRVSFHTGFRVLRSVFVLSLFDCGRPKKTRSDYTPEFRPARISAPAGDAPAHLGDGEPATPGEHQGGALHKHRGLGDAWESLDFVTPWGLFPQGEGEKGAQGRPWGLRSRLSRSKGGGSGESRSCHSLMCLSRTRVQNLRQKKLKEISANESKRNQSNSQHHSWISPQQDQESPVHKAKL